MQYWPEGATGCLCVSVLEHAEAHGLDRSTMDATVEDIHPCTVRSHHQGVMKNMIGTVGILCIRLADISVRYMRHLHHILKRCRQRCIGRKKRRNRIRALSSQNSVCAQCNNNQLSPNAPTITPGWHIKIVVGSHCAKNILLQFETNMRGILTAM